MFRLFPLKIVIRQHGKNQGVVIKNNEDRTIKITTIDEQGKKQPYYPKQESTLLYLIKNMYWSTWKKLLFGLAVVVAVVVLGVNHLIERDTLENRLYAQYYRPMKTHSSVFIIENSAFDEAKKRYLEGDNIAALLIMENLPSTFSFKKEQVFYQALTLMELERYQDAIGKFKVLTETPNNKDIIATVKWYQGLCYLKTMEMEKARKTFESIPASSPKKYKKAQKILQELI